MAKPLMLLAACLLCLTALTPAHGAEDRLGPDAFLYAAPVVPPKDGFAPGGLYMIEFPAQFMAGPMHPDLGAVRLFDDAGREVPFSLLPAAVPSRPERAVKLAVTSFAEYGNTLKLVAELPPDRRVGEGGIVALDIASANRDFAYWATVEGRTADGWQPLAEGPLYDFSSRVDLRRTRIELPPSGHAAYRLHLSIAEHMPDEIRGLGLAAEELRKLLLGEGKKPFRIDALNAVVPGNKAQAKTVETRTTDFQTDTTGDATTITLQGPRRLESVRFEIRDPAFARKAEIFTAQDGGEYRRRASGELSRVPGKEDRTTLALPGAVYDHLRIVIRNGDNPPLAVDALDFSYTARNLFFYAGAETTGYTLRFGLPKGLLPPLPRYDTARMVTADNWDGLTSTRLDLGEAERNGAAPDEYAPLPTPSSPGSDKLLLYAVAALLGAGLLAWLILLLRRDGPAKPKS